MSQPTASSATLRDFPDWLNPILVKELRQGLRNRGFVFLLMFLQCIMAVVVVVALAGTNPGSGEGARTGMIVSGFFFALFSIAGLGIQPLRGLDGLASEIRHNTLDLLALTRLNVWRITYGKWLALFSQTALLLISILPYLIMRYFLGGMQLFNELLCIFTLLAVSGAVTAIAIGLSAMKSVVLRILLGLGAIFGIGGSFLTAASVFMFERSGFSDLDPSRPGFAWGYLSAIGVILFVGYYFLEIGATQIAPPSENRSTRKRLLGLAMIVFILCGVPWMEEARTIIANGLAVLLIIDALTESPRFTASVMRPFRKRGAVGKVVGMFLLPGWPAGTLFTAVISLILIASHKLMHTGSYSFWGELAGFRILSITALLVPTVILAIGKKAHKNIMGPYFAIQIGGAVVGMILTILGNAMDFEEAIAWMFFVFPILGLMGIDEIIRDSGIETLAGISFIVWWCILFVLGMPWRNFGSALKEYPDGSPEPTAPPAEDEA